MTESAKAVRQRYDRLASVPASSFAEHVHHGYWLGAGDLAAAQTKLIEELARFARIPRGARVLDIGCGTGGSARWLVENLSCSVLGISISPVEIANATAKASAAGMHEQVKFRVGDANNLDFPEASFDAVWIVETSEHVSDRRHFFETCARLLASGGRIAIATCVSPAQPTPPQIKRLGTVRRVLLTEPLSTLAEYVDWMRARGFDQIQTKEITDRVAPTWSYLLQELRKERDHSLDDKMAQREMFKLLTTMKTAYADGAIGYALLSAGKDGR